ncbi:ABC transporter ATP-binding protein [Tropicimonas sp. IMCC34043]|uniref:ABC transporter ATP-binding protein n=1 Tax=Tropicimonas sp. IMCC34043 TaxID=2248760 RepID=UPI000E24D724|nr:ABC transporter ATP-binding protein [Tropicimonas sp. IMCC34043]
MAKKKAKSKIEPEDAKLIRRLLTESIPPRWRLYLLSLAFMIGVASFTSALAYSTKLIVNEVFVAGNLSRAWSVSLLVIGVSFGAALSDYGNTVVGKMLNRSIASHYTRLVFETLIGRDVATFTGVHPAKMMNQVLMFGRAAATIVLRVSNNMLSDALILIGLVSVMVMQDPGMSIFSATLFPVIFLLVGWLSRQIKKVAKSETELSGAMYSIGSETFEGIKTVKSYGLEDRSRLRFADAVMDLENRVLSIARWTAATVPSMQLLGGVVIGMFVMYASWQTVANGKTPGEFTAFITAFLLAYQPAERLSKAFVDIQQQLVQVENMYRLVDAPPARKLDGTESLADRPATLRFDNVSFHYGHKIPALINVDFELKPGEKIAIVGRSGAGKTTTIDLVQRFFDPTAGRVMIGGVDLRDVTVESLRESVALLSQEVFLFEGSIRENILDGNRDASREAVELAAHLAMLDELAAALPKGLDSEVGPKGNQLSGGQKQRVGIARALLKEAKVYIFDEATSALDGENEREIVQKVIASRPDRTMLFVTHRPATLNWVDRIMLLEGGRLVALDTHENLLANYPIYRSLFNLAEAEGGLSNDIDETEDEDTLADDTDDFDEDFGSEDGPDDDAARRRVVS